MCISGIWADDSGDEANDSGSRAHFQGVSKKKQSYSTPVSFVAGGVQQAGKKKDEAAKEKKPTGETPMEEDEEADENVQIGSSR